MQRLDRAGYVTLKGTDRNLYVELKEGTDGARRAASTEPASAIAAAPESMPERVTESAARNRHRRRPRAGAASQSRREEPIEPDSQLAILPRPMLASEPDLDELDAAAYAAAHGMPPPGRGRRDGREDRDGATGAVDATTATAASATAVRGPGRAMADSAMADSETAAAAGRAACRRRRPIRPSRPTATR